MDEALVTDEKRDALDDASCVLDIVDVEIEALRREVDPDEDVRNELEAVAEPDAVDETERSDREEAGEAVEDKERLVMLL